MIARIRHWLRRARSVPASVEETRRLTEAVHRRSVETDTAGPAAAGHDASFDAVHRRLDAVTGAIDVLRHEIGHANAIAGGTATQHDELSRLLSDTSARVRIDAYGAARSALAGAARPAVDRAARDHAVERRVPGCSVIVVAVDGHDDASGTIDDAGRLLSRLGDADAATVVVAAPTADLRAVDHRLDDGRTVVVRLDLDLPVAEATALALRCCPTRHALVAHAGDRLDLEGAAALAEAARTLDATIAYGETVGLAPVVTVPGGRPQTRVVRSLSAPPARTGVVDATVEALVAVVDVDRVLALGAISTRPEFRSAGADAELLQRLLDRGELVVWVPLVTARRPVRGADDDPHRAVAAGSASAAIAATRPTEPAERATVVWHPATGVVEATTAARRRGV